ncbi:DNA replication and repair protein RecF [compost metagenome]
MIDARRIEAMLRIRYPDLEDVGDGVFRGVERFGSRDYAIRYFDLNDRLAETASSLKGYQEKVLSQMYFSSQVATDLRWNHYLYFVTSSEAASRNEFSGLKTRVEADREYARKLVIREDEVTELLATSQEVQNRTNAMPIDLATTWSQALEKQGLGFVLDDSISVPKVVQRIATGAKDSAARPVAPMALLPAELAAANRILKHLSISGFRPHPEQKEHPLGRVNLIVGSNGVGKTSLLEAIEFAYCGKNRRSSAVLTGTSINLEFAGVTEELSSTTDAARLRARHSNWYAKTELKTVNIQDSFGKFNFLDTDAAVNLSVSASSSQIGADVTRLVLGATAENLADRLRRVFEQLQDELKNSRRDNAFNSQLKQAAEDRLAAIKNSPKLSDGLFLEVLAALRLLGWKLPPEEKGHISVLRENLQEAISATELLRHSSIDILHSDPDRALELLAILNEEASKATALDDRAKAATLAHSKAHREAKAALERNTTIEALLPYARVDFARLAKETEVRQDNLRARRAKLALVAISTDASTVQPLLGQHVTEAISTVENQVETHQKRVAAAQSSLQALERTQNHLTVLRQRLLSTAQDILQHAPNPDHCPLCRTEFESGQLLTRMMANVEGSTSEQAGLLQAELASAGEALTRAHAALATLQPMVAFLSEQAQTVTVSQALQQIDHERAQLERESSDLEAALHQMQQLQVDGLTSQSLSSSLLAAGLAELPPLESLQKTQEGHKAEIEKSQQAIRTALKQSHDVQQECEALAARLSIESFDSPETLAKNVKKLVTDMETALGAEHTLKSLLTMDANTTADEISINLSSTQQLLAKVATAIAQEGVNDSALAKEAQSVADLSSKIETSDNRISHLVEAERVLETLTQQSSGGELTNQILAENAQEIARTFASIHMPNEFEIKSENGKLAIVRRQTGEEVELDHMSTGQRAAFALSLFLAMNGRLRSGPPVLLFDDPVAHVDDINVLSFLDHLRQLAIGGSRQIFFATADTKLAGLFRHKFRFLCDDFKEIVLSRS